MVKRNRSLPPFQGGTKKSSYLFLNVFSHSPSRGGERLLVKHYQWCNKNNFLGILLLIIIMIAPCTVKAKPDTLFLEVNIVPGKIYVQSQVVFTVQFFRSVEITGASVTDPQTSESNAVIEKLGEDKNLETDRNGIHYLVVERRYAIFPQRSGKLTILPIRLDARVGKRGDPLVDFFKDPLREGEIFAQRHSPAVEIVVEPIPSSFDNLSWLPAHQLRLTEKWSKNPPRLQVGETVIRTVTLQATGLTSAQLPELAFARRKLAGQEAILEQLSSSIKRYPDPPSLTDQREPTGILGIRQETWAMIPSRPGTFTLPSIEVPWWNVDTKTEEVAYLPGRTLEVLGSVHPTSVSSAVANADKDPAHLAHSVQEKQSTAQKERDKRCENGVDCDSNKPITWINSFIATEAYSPILTLFLALGWASTALGWYLYRHPSLNFSFFKPKAETIKNRNNPDSLEKIAQSLKQVCLQNDPEKCRSVLLTWAQARWHDKKLRNLNDLQYLLMEQHDEAFSQYFLSSVQKPPQQPSGEKQSETPDPRLTPYLSIATLSQEIVELNRALFSPMARPWNGKILWESVQTLCVIPKRRDKQTPLLPPLYVTAHSPLRGE